MDIKKINEILKNKNNTTLFVIILIGAALMLYPSGKKEEKPKQDNATTEYNNNEEKRLEEILKEVDGVGDVSVMITYASGVESDLAYDINSQSSQKEFSDKEINCEENTDKKAVISQGEPFIKRYVYPEVKGAVIAAQGADNILVKSEIQEVAVAVLGVDRHRVCVVRKKTK